MKNGKKYIRRKCEEIENRKRERKEKNKSINASMVNENNGENRLEEEGILEKHKKNKNWIKKEKKEEKEVKGKK